MKQLKPQQQQQQKSNKSSSNFDWSDLKLDKTQFFDKTPNRSTSINQHTSPFEHKEISARSTTIQYGSTKSALDFDTIMKTSISAAVKNKYRESMASGRLSVMSNQKLDTWDEKSLMGRNLTFSSDEFKPAEEMASKLDEDERNHEMEYAVIPQVDTQAQTKGNMSLWDENFSIAGRQYEMSFGQHCANNIRFENVREIFPDKSPPKRQNRVALVELSTNNDKTICDEETSRLSLLDSMNLEQLIRKNSKEDKIIQIRKAKVLEQMQMDNHSFSNSMSEMIEDLSFDKIMERAKIECKNAEKKNRQKAFYDEDEQEEPVQDDDDECNYQLKRADQNNRGVKRRPTSACSTETPLSILDKCHRSKSPTNRKELELAAAKLKPQMIPDENIFKQPRPYTDSTLKGASSSSTINREYLTAMESLSIRSPGEKLSLPNYALSSRTTFKSPTSTNRSKFSQWSPNSSEGQLKRSASQLSANSEFQDDFLPIKIDNSDNRKLSFPTVKVDKVEIKTFTIQNGSDKKLPLKVRVVGAGFSVSPKEEFRMVPLEARTFQVRFSPSVIGPAYGKLIFELSTNRICSKTIPLFGYGGHTNVQIEGVQKGPFGPSFITMGMMRDLGMVIEKTIRLTNSGTLPSFASIIFEKTKLSDFTMSDSISVYPMQLKIEPGRKADVKIRFKATKLDIRKIITTNKDVTTIGEICIIYGDEPTRLRVLMNKNRCDAKLLNCLPKSLPNEAEIQSKLVKFNEELSKDKLSIILSQIRTHEIALTINKNLDDTQMFPNELSLADDTHMNFETFIDTNYTRIATHDEGLSVMEEENVEVLESQIFKISPAILIFNQAIDIDNNSKILTIELLERDSSHFFEVVPSNSKLINIDRPHGKIKYGEMTKVNVMLTTKCLETLHLKIRLYLTILIKDARVEIPIEIK
ncbi:hypothetical protein PVAND_008513 [Polypedilum vanderplanki]|uniref:Cep192/Spd-2-like domain-containing protein n=1 Tax=Polypedilum vanderplanki TaxID=319348 RepID=A0A9J6CAF8_POLVA|nr:hypothetical protein PVAND_008513 [Polypedilum vanderplanki]